MSTKSFKKESKPPINIVWLKRDIRLADHEGFYLAEQATTLLFEQARLLEGKMPDDPAQFSRIMNQFLLKAIPN